MATYDRPPVIERLHSNVGKRKSTTPQKFVGGYWNKAPVKGVFFFHFVMSIHDDHPDAVFFLYSITL